MDATIAHLHVRYVGVADTLPGAARARLDDMIRHRSLEHMETTLEEALAGDNAVYILRRVRTALVLNLETASGDDLARWMGTHLASAAMLAVARAEGNTDNLIRFRSQAEYVARFVTDLARADDCDKWYYTPLRDLAALASSDEIESVLFRNADFLPAILTCLQESGDLPGVLHALHPSAVESLWSRGLRTSSYTAESFRPLFRAALDLLPPNDPVTNEADFEAWLMTRPPAPDWRDRSSLTAAVEAMLHFLATRHRIEPQSPVNDESVMARMDWLDTAILRDAVKDVFEAANLPRIVMGLVLDALPPASTTFPRLTQVEPTLMAARENVIAEYLASASRHSTGDLRVALIDAIRFLQTRGYISGEEEVERLKAEFPEIQVNSSQQRSAVLPLRPVSRKPTPTRRELLSDIRALLDEHPGYLTADKTTSGAIRLYAALIAAYPRWGQPDAPSGMVANAIERVLEGAPDDVVVERRAASRSKQTNSAPAELEAAFANRLAAAYSPSEVDSACAGVFLLLRAVLDSRLCALSTTLKYPACSHEFPVLLASLALRWSGAGGCRDDGRLDPGIIALAGPDAPRTLAELAGAWTFTEPVDHARFSYGLLKMLGDHRLLAGTELHLSRVPYQGAWATVANSEVSGLWPLASLYASESTIAEWIKQWAGATGNTPAVFTTEALPVGWEAFEEGTLGLPDADLALTLIANALVRLWARWLRRFADSSASYLLTNFIRRPGLISESPDGLVVRMNRGPLDLILDMAGYSRDLDQIPGVLPRRIRFQWTS